MIAGDVHDHFVHAGEIRVLEGVEEAGAVHLERPLEVEASGGVYPRRGKPGGSLGDVLDASLQSPLQRLFQRRRQFPPQLIEPRHGHEYVGVVAPLKLAQLQTCLAQLLERAPRCRRHRRRILGRGKWTTERAAAFDRWVAGYAADGH